MADPSIDGMSARLTAFATAGAITTTQETVSVILTDVEGAEPDLVAEETICLVSVVTAGAVEAGSGGRFADVAGAMMELPLLYRDYIIGGMMIDGDETAAEAYSNVYDRLVRARSFYAAHFPPGHLAGPRVLEDKMPLWMGRVSPPRLPEMPDRRLSRLGLVQPLAAHARLVMEYARQLAAEDVKNE